MGRGATKASGNVWYRARMDAAKWNDRLNSRFGAAEEIGMSEDAIKNTELGLEKCMPVDKAVLLADLYKAPELLNYYCLNECPIGRNMDICDEVVEIDRAAVHIVKCLDDERIRDIKRKIIQIADDGVVDRSEMTDFNDIVDHLRELNRCISEVILIAEKGKCHDRRDEE